jgi:tetratricopeptide (TPR) repeat protein
MAENGHAQGGIALFRALADVEEGSRSTMLVNIGNAYLRLGDTGLAVDSYQDAIKIDPKNALAYRRLGDLENEAGRWESAANNFAKACELESENWSHHACAGTAYLRNQTLARAISHLRRSVELFPEQPLTLYNLAAALLSEGDGEAAVDVLANAVRIDKEYARGWYLKAQIEARLERLIDAEASAHCALANSSLLSADEVKGLKGFMEKYRLA